MVGPDGSVLGIDRNAGLIEIARREHRLSNLQFECVDAAQVSMSSLFDIVTAARTLQWIGEPLIAIQNMCAAAKPGGLIVVLDYNHADNTWDPDPPSDFMRFYQAFLSWRQANHWDNRMADHLPPLFRDAGLSDIESHMQDEVAERGYEGFVECTKIWSEVIDNVGTQIADAGHFDPAKLQSSKLIYEKWVEPELRKQTLRLRVVVGAAQ